MENHPEKLQEMLLEAYKLIKEKDQDLGWAAQIGQDLLTKNENLEKELKILTQKLNETSEKKKLESKVDGDNTLDFNGLEKALEQNQHKRLESLTELEISSLESSLESLQKENNELKEEISKLNENKKEIEKNLIKSTQDFELIKDEVQKFQRMAEQLEEEKKNLLKEKIDLNKILKEKKNSTDEATEALARIVQEMEEKLFTMERENDELNKFKHNFEYDLNDSKKKCIELENILEEYRDYRMKYEQSQGIIVEMEGDLEILRNYTESLKAMLAVFEPNKDGKSDVGGKSLLGEVEDRRMELEGENEILAKNNARLKHNNMLSLNERSKMKLHIQTLTLQQAQSSFNYSGLKPLQAALSQAESEKKQLLDNIKELDTKLVQLTLSSHQNFNNIHEFSRDEVIECLRIKLEQVSGEATSLRKELRTALMLKLSETEKLRNAESVLRLESENLELSKRQINQLKFQIEEEKNKNKYQSVELKANKQTSTEDLLNTNCLKKIVTSTTIRKMSEELKNSSKATPNAGTSTSNALLNRVKNENEKIKLKVEKKPELPLSEEEKKTTNKENLITENEEKGKYLKIKEKKTLEKKNNELNNLEENNSTTLTLDRNNMNENCNQQ
ncbi:hypothetical protein HK099_007286 [Clydaea vesicula]|uniref:Uncharacterized protein n=1 Tax=Clydaea vesicula TaxID=447962 RepID=A0AAD5TX84_9FUNG|nr:hypothetical protein HK099_007286 [Clydaea vesicula]